MILTGLALSFFAWAWSVWRGFGVSIICGLLNFFFPPISQFIFCLYEKRLRTPTLLMFLGAALSSWSAWHDIRDFLNRHQFQPGGVMVQQQPRPASGDNKARIHS